VLTVSTRKQIQTSGRIVNIKVKTYVSAMMAYEEVKAPLHSFLTFPLDAANDQLHARITLPLGIGPPVSTEQENGWTPGPIWTLFCEDKSLASFGIRTTINRAFML